MYILKFIYNLVRVALESIAFIKLNFIDHVYEKAFINHAVLII